MVSGHVESNTSPSCPFRCLTKTLKALLIRYILLKTRAKFVWKYTMWVRKSIFIEFKYFYFIDATRGCLPKTTLSMWQTFLRSMVFFGFFFQCFILLYMSLSYSNLTCYFNFYNIIVGTSGIPRSKNSKKISWNMWKEFFFIDNFWDYTEYLKNCLGNTQ